MGLTRDVLARWAARRPHLLVAAVPGATGARLAVEAHADRAGWPLAASPADADLLVVAGDPGAELAAAIERVWEQLPGPRARTRITDPAGAAPALRTAVARLSGAGGKPPDPGHREPTRHGPEVSDARQAGHGQHGGGAGRHGHGEHEGMSMPGGLMMAERAEDRDGLTLDVLHLALGPVLADWPAGLVVELTVQGDVVQSASARVLRPAEPAAVRPYRDVDHPGLARRRQAVAHLDSLGRLWAVAGWPAGAATARRLRDALVDHVPLAVAYTGLRPLARRARRSRALRLATDGLGALTPVAAARAGVDAPAAVCGDATARWWRRLAETDRLLAGGDPGAAPEPDAAAVLELAARLVVGLDLAAARVVLASIDPDPDGVLAGGTRS
ncbi:hypothetical protein O7600_07465 [Micromonospora sp. WMMA1998]|uniref:hypothetical protein n=1 Tax=Micromonospora sp. WMMA1998 TaxID=3015167 RepID=UPI00248AF7A1|nr:hypothetical protein [Micromonospora sp. WMMA1998]WBC16670.1 hypothetical protein O7600_07465 [Micromonospora sp. WMMA1998]